MAGLEDLSPEILIIILGKLPVKTLLNFSECSRTLHSECLGNNLLWKALCKQDFDVDLNTWYSFDSCHEVYRLIYKARVILEETNNTAVSGMPPDWMFAWCMLSKKPPSYAYNRLARGKAKKLWNLKDENLPLSPFGFDNSSFSWKDCYEIAIAKHGSLINFQKHTLRRCARSQNRVSSMYPKSAQTKRKIHFLQTFRNQSEEPDLVVKQTLINTNGQDSVVTIENMTVQKIGDDFISGKLRFGRPQLEEYTKFGKELYANIINVPCCLSINDIVSCVLLTYEQIGDGIYDHLYKKDEFLELADKYKSRMSLVWDWQIEKGLAHQIEFRGSRKVKQSQAYNDFIKYGNMKDFQSLRTHFEGLENLSLWLEENTIITGLLNTSVRSVLEGRKSSFRTPEARGVSAKVERYLNSGSDEHLRALLKTVSTIARSYLSECSAYLNKLDGQLENMNIEISSIIRKSRKRSRALNDTDALGQVNVATESVPGPSAIRRCQGYPENPSRSTMSIFPKRSSIEISPAKIFADLMDMMSSEH